MDWDSINRELAEAFAEETELEILVKNMSKFDIDKWIKPYNEQQQINATKIRMNVLRKYKKFTEVSEMFLAEKII